jgi:hypothetical protein
MPARQETVGTSPKAIAAAITAAVAPVVVGLALNQVGVEIDVETAAAIIGPIVLGAVTFLAARLAGPGTVVRKEADR